MKMGFDFKRFNVKFKDMRKRNIVIAGMIVFFIMVFYLRFSGRDNFQALMEINPRHDFSSEEIKAEEWETFQKGIEAKKSEEKEVERNIFYSYSRNEEGIPKLAGVILGKKRAAIFSNGKILQEGDALNNLIVETIKRGEVILSDEKGDKKVLELWRK